MAVAQTTFFFFSVRGKINFLRFHKDREKRLTVIWHKFHFIAVGGCFRPSESQMIASLQVCLPLLLFSETTFYGGLKGSVLGRKGYKQTKNSCITLYCVQVTSSLP